MKQWIFNEMLGFPQCPVCKRWIHVCQGDAEMNYCPNRGERLDGKEFKKCTLNGRVATEKQSIVL